MQVQALTGSHNRQTFDCGRVELNDWLRQVAKQHQEKGLSKTFVAVQPNEPARIGAYYALTLSELVTSQIPQNLAKKWPRRIPGIRLGRLAVDIAFQGKRLAELMLVDALTRAHRIHQEAGGMGLFVDAIDDQAAGFYRHFGFASSPSQPLLLFLPLGALTAKTAKSDKN